MDQPRTGRRAGARQPMWQARVQRNRRQRVLRLLALLDQADAIDQGIRLDEANQGIDGRFVQRIDANMQAPTCRQRIVAGQRRPQRTMHLDVTIRREMPVEGIAEHAAGAKHEHAHRQYSTWLYWPSSAARTKGRRRSSALVCCRSSCSVLSEL